MDVNLYVNRTRVQWRYLPRWKTVDGYFAKWPQDSAFAQLNRLLRQPCRRPWRRHEDQCALTRHQGLHTDHEAVGWRTTYGWITLTLV